MLVDYKLCQDLINQLKKFTEVEFIMNDLDTEENPYKLQYTSHIQYVRSWKPERLITYLDTLEEMGLVKPKYYNIILGGNEALTDFSTMYKYLPLLSSRCIKIIIPSNGRILEMLSKADIDKFIELSNNKIEFHVELTEPFTIELPLSTYGRMLRLPEKRQYYKIFKYIKDMPNIFKLFIRLDYSQANSWFNTYMELIKFRVDYSIMDPHYGHDKLNEIANSAYQLGKIALTRRINNQSDIKFDDRVPGAFNQNRIVINYDGNAYIDPYLTEPTYNVADLVSKRIDPRKIHYYYQAFNTKNILACIRCPIRDCCHEPKLAYMQEYWGRSGVVTVPILSNCKYQLLKSYIFTKYGCNNNAPLVSIKLLENLIRKYFDKDVPEAIKMRYTKDKLID